MPGFAANVGIEEGVERYVEWVQRQEPDLESWWSQEKMITW